MRNSSRSLNHSLILKLPLPSTWAPPRVIHLCILYLGTTKGNTPLYPDHYFIKKGECTMLKRRNTATFQNFHTIYSHEKKLFTTCVWVKQI